MNTPSLSIGTAFSKAFDSFKQGGLLMTVMVLVAGVIISISNFIPLLGPLITTGPLLLGLSIAALALHDGKPFEFGILFQGFQKWIPSVVTGTLVQLITLIPILFCIGVGIAMALGSAAFGLEKIGMGLIAIVVLVCFCISIIGYTLLGLWSFFMADGKAEGVDCIGASFRLSRNHIPLLIISFIICAILAMAGMIVLFVGIFPAMALALLFIASLYRQLIPAGASMPPLPTESESVGYSPITSPDTTATPLPSTSTPGKGSGTTLLLVILIIVLGGGGAAAYFVYQAFQKGKSKLASTMETAGLGTEAAGSGIANQIAKTGFQQMLQSISPDLEMKSFDSKTGKFSVLNKATGETMMVDLATGQGDLEKLMATIEKAAEANTMEIASTPSATPAEESKSETAIASTKTAPETAFPTLTENAQAPSWVPSYAGAEIKEQMNQSIEGVHIGSTTFTTKDEISKVGAFFEEKLKQAGFQIETTKDEEGDKMTSLNISGQTADSKKICAVVISTEEETLNINVSYTETP